MEKRKNSLSRVRSKIMAWSMRRSISSKIEDMLHKHCDVKPPKKPKIFLDPKTGIFKYDSDDSDDSDDFDEDYFYNP